MSLEVGSVIQGKYRIVSLIGRGGMGSVYEGENTLIARRVAIKVLHGDLGAHPEAIERFEREAQAAGRIGNDHILEVLDLGELAGGERFMVMEFLEGETLEDRLDRKGTLTARELYPIVRQLLLGLDAAHGKGIIHRDLKPENVFILASKAGQADFVKIIDFGISKFTGSVDLRMTATGAVMGTPYYMSPEQAKGAKGIDFRSDLYAVGVILYRAATGHVPYTGENFNEILFKIVLSSPVNPRELQPSLDPGFESLILRSMARDAAHRFQSAAEFVSALDAWYLDGSGVSAPPPDRGSMVSHPGLSPVASAPGNTTTGEWTRSGLAPQRKTSPLLWVALAALAAGGAIAGGVLWLQSSEKDATASASTGELPLVSAKAPETEPPVGAAPTTDTPKVEPVEDARSAEPSASADGTATVSSAEANGSAEGSGSAEANGSAEPSDESAEASKAIAEGPKKSRRPVRRPGTRRPAETEGQTPTTPPKDKPPAKNDELDFGY